MKQKGNSWLYSLDTLKMVDVRSIESRWKIKFPKDYIDILSHVNGGSPTSPVLCLRDKKNKTVKDRLCFMFGITNETTTRSAELMNGTFFKDDGTDNNYWIIGVCERLGHVVLKCDDDSIYVGDLNATYGIPDDGFPYVFHGGIMKLIVSLNNETKGKWTPINWEV